MLRSAASNLLLWTWGRLHALVEIRHVWIEAKLQHCPGANGGGVIWFARAYSGKMKPHLVMVGLALLMGCASRQSTGPAFYRVALECPAAPKIGCGSAAKPILLELEKQGIREAWLNREGTVIAVMPGERSERIVTRVLEAHEVEGKEVAGAERGAIAQSFAARAGWLRGADVDMLSMEEAGIIAERILRRVNAKTPLAENQRTELRAAFKKLIEARFMQKVGPSSQEEWREKTLDLAKPVLSREQISALEDALAQGFRPRVGEE